MSSYFKTILTQYKLCLMRSSLNLSLLKLKTKTDHFKHEVSGVAAVEFALILPLMLLMYVGTLEITRLYAADRKAVLFAHTIADLATQAATDTLDANVASINDSQLALIFGLGASVLYPFKSEGASVRLTMFAFDNKVPANGKAKGFVDWQELCTINADGTTCTPDTAPLLDTPTKQPRCSRQDIDVGFATNGGYTMLAEVGFKYAPILGGLYPFMPSDGQILKKNALHMQPRNKPNVIRTNNNKSPKYPHETPDTYYVAVACASTWDKEE
jgi:TadE-like protein